MIEVGCGSSIVVVVVVVAYTRLLVLLAGEGTTILEDRSQAVMPPADNRTTGNLPLQLAHLITFFLDEGGED